MSILCVPVRVCERVCICVLPGCHAFDWIALQRTESMHILFLCVFFVNKHSCIFVLVFKAIYDHICMRMQIQILR